LAAKHNSRCTPTRLNEVVAAQVNATAHNVNARGRSPHAHQVQRPLDEPVSALDDAFHDDVVTAVYGGMIRSATAVEEGKS